MGDLFDLPNRLFLQLCNVVYCLIFVAVNIHGKTVIVLNVLVVRFQFFVQIFLLRLSA